MGSDGTNGTKGTKATPAAVSRFQSFTAETIHRSELKNAPYNPRHITARNKAKLKESLGKVGLVQPLVWNRRTGNLVGGHQRLAQLDALEGTRDYQLTVAVVEVDEIREKELNVLLNNPDVCGDWDLPKLKEILQTETLDLAATGFDWGEFQQMFGEAPSQPEEEHQEELAKDLKKVMEAYDRLSKAHVEKDDRDFYCVVVFGSWNERKEFLETFGFEDNRYLDGRTLVTLFRDLKEAQLAAPGPEVKGPSTGQNEAEGTLEPA